MINIFASELGAARALMADSLGFHIIFALLGVGLPLALSLVEFWGLRKKDNNIIEAARKLSMVAIVLVVAGVVSGTILAIQMPLMWPGLVKFGSKIIGLPFMFEGYMFLLEALFLTFYVASWGKIKGYRHWLLSLPIILGSLGSAFFITTVNSWMQNPQGFDGVDKAGNLINPQVWEGVFTKTTLFMTTHSILGYYAATFLLVAGGYAWFMLYKKPEKADRKVAEFLMYRFAALAVAVSLVIGFIGHLNLQYLAESQPHKFAAIELVPKTTKNAPYTIGGVLDQDTNTVKGGVQIPNMLSLLTTNTIDGEVPGLDKTPKKDWPLLIIHTLFEIKMIFVGLMILIPLGYLLSRKFAKKLSRSKAMLLAMVMAGPFALIVIELGWMVTEFGRQPYIVRGHLLVEDAFSNSPAVVKWGYIFPVLYVLLFIVTYSALLLVLKRFKNGSEK